MADLTDDEIKQSLESILNRNYQSMELLAPMEVRLRLDRAIGRQDINQSEGSANIDYLCQITRDPRDGDRAQPANIPDLFSQNSRLTCLSKFKQVTRDSVSIGPKLAICICAYNQGKHMLKESLNGVYDSLQKFRTQAGVHAEQIVVTVIFDGIQKVGRGDFDQDIITMFDEYDFRNGAILKQGEKPFLEVVEKNIDALKDIDWSKVSSYLPDEIEEKTRNRFRTRYDDYMNYRQLQKVCEDSSHSIDVDKVPKEVKEEYLRLKSADIRDKLQFARVQFREVARKRNITQQPELSNEEKRFLESKRIQIEEKFQNYANHKKHMEKAYSNLLELTKKYFQSREQTTLIYPIKYVPSLIQKEADDNNLDPPDQLNVLLCVKHRNAGKLSSHALFFLGFCQFMQPQICLLLDVGLKPLENAIFHMFKYMDHNTNTGGVCGYMGLQVERAGDQFGNSDMEHLDSLSNFLHNSLFSIQRAQMFQYHFGHLIDKPFEAAFNFIHVLPGAFSCYRYSCLEGPRLHQYLSPVLDSKKQRSLEEENRFLAEDRTLSLVLKANRHDFAYIPTAKAVVDPASDLSTLLAQRRRWINGSWFSFFHVFDQRGQIVSCATHFQFWYYILIQGVSYVSIGLFFAALYISVDSILSQYVTLPEYGNISNANVHNGILAIVMFIYVFSLGAVFFLSLQVKNNDKKFQSIYYGVSTFLGVYGVLVMILMIFNLVDLANTNFGLGLTQANFYQLGLPPGSPVPIVIGAMMVATFAIYTIQVLFSFSFRIIWEVLISTPSYLFYAPTYLHILNIYAFCKIDDFSWGTKGLEKGSSGKAFLQEQNKLKKFRHVSKFLFCNVLVAIVFTIFIVNNQQTAEGLNGRTIYMLVFSGFLLLVTLFKFLLSIGYLVYFYLGNLCVRYTEETKRRNENQGMQVNNQVSKQLLKVKDRYLKDATQALKRRFNNTVSQVRKTILLSRR